MKRIFPTFSPTLKFWLSFLLLDFFLFLPFYLLHLHDSSFLPSPHMVEKTLWGYIVMLYSRANMDFFRICGDFVVLTGVLFVVRKWKWVNRIVFPVVVVAYLFLFIYHIYYIVSLKLYGAHPYFLNDWVLAIEVLPIFLEQISLGSATSYATGILLGIATLSVLLFLLIVLNRSIGKLELGRGWAIILGVTVFVLGIFAWKNARSEAPHDYSTVQWISKKIAVSASMTEADKFKTFPFIQVYEKYLEQKLKVRPNVYCLFIESYGEIVYEDEGIRAQYLPNIRDAEQQLSKSGWHSATNLSESPIIGGRSWLAFTSSFIGAKITNQPQFNDLQNLWPDYPHLIRFFKQQGYYTYRMKSMSGTKLSKKVNYDFANRFYGFDQWTKFPDIPYKGYVYDWFGGIPDQYAVNYWHDEILEEKNQPFFMFFITMDSHGPWFPTGKVHDDWRMLDTVQHPPFAISDTTRDKFGDLRRGVNNDRYAEAINYEVDFVTDFILKKGEENSIFLVIGDHQPGIITRQRRNSFRTPFHVIAKDSTFVNSFGEYGFVEGLEIPDHKKIKSIKHEGFYSLIVREMLRHYGEEGVDVPLYLPEGL